MSLLSDFETKAEAMADAMFDHATVTAALKKKVEAGEAKIEDAVKGVETSLATAKDEILGEVRTMLDTLKTELLGDFGKVSTDAVEKAKDAVAALKSEDDDTMSVPGADTLSGATGTDSVAPAAIADTVSGSDSVSAAPSAPVVATAPSGATTVVVPADVTDIHTDEATGVLTMPGTVSHVDDAGVHTTVPLDGSAPTAVDAVGATVDPVPAAAVAEATNAALAAGVEVAAPSA